MVANTTHQNPTMEDAATKSREHGKLEEVMEQLCESSDDEDETPLWTRSRIDEMAVSVNEILNEGEGGESSVSALGLKKVEDCYGSCNQKCIKEAEHKEYTLLETFILDEQKRGRESRAEAKELEASEEKRLASEVALLKGIRLNAQKTAVDEDLRWEISDAERAYVGRKMAYSKAAQVASSHCRVQFARVRTFLQKQHQSRLHVLRKKYLRDLKYQTLIHHLRGTDPRIVSLEEQKANRIYEKKKADLNETHMAQTLEESSYLEAMMGLLDNVQIRKETAARELFYAHVEHVKAMKESAARRTAEMSEFSAASTMEMAKLVARYTDENADDAERELKIQERVDRSERRKGFEAAPGNEVMAVGKLFDTVIWSVATDDVLLTSSASSSYSSTYGGDHRYFDYDNDDATNSTDEEVGAPQKPAPARIMHAKQLAKEFKAKEKAIVKKHEAEVDGERRIFRAAIRTLQSQHDKSMNKVLEDCLIERTRLREAIGRRMVVLAKEQEEKTYLLQRRDSKLTSLLMEAIQSEKQRLVDAKANSFVQAQELISAQVFHEVRNALSAVIAMSEMTESLKTDKTLTAEKMGESVGSMLEQINEVVDYALKMLNNVLDVSKINSGAFVANKEPFDLNQVMARATRMQLAKANRIKMSFVPPPTPSVAVSDGDIVERVVAGMISNSVKFTKTGAVQPFVWPLEDLLVTSDSEPSSGLPADKPAHGMLVDTEDKLSHMSSEGETVTEDSFTEHDAGGTVLPGLRNTKMRMVAVGVADTGSGLSEEVLVSALSGIKTSSSRMLSHGAQNTGFGLYHAHLQAKALNTKLQLSSLERCRPLLNQNMINALDSVEKEDSSRGDRPLGHGTVLFLTVPVYEDGDGALEALQTQKEASETPSDHVSGGATSDMQLTFRPQPPPTSSHGAFRVLVADDVLMLRKGMVHSITNLWSERFPDCPVSISTACSAEDVLRAASSQPFDLIISDHSFNVYESKLNAITTNSRPCIVFDESVDSPEQKRERTASFFKDERFTIQEGDGSLLGLQALEQLAGWDGPPFPTPVLFLVSGHKIETTPELGIIVAQKPLKQSDMVALLESQALNLVSASLCEWQGAIHDGNDGSSQNNPGRVLVNGHGSQMFVCHSGEDGAG